eukprot:m.207931 g.207931  ORF g.207931 m.207931 type:complete len:353 (+) comp18950_c0_seq3:199-1257(+)
MDVDTDASTKEENTTLTSKDYYFDSYAHFGIHEEMLKDEVRTLTYRRSIFQNEHQFKGKVVLDVGCGTGILSMFAAKAGAQHVYAIECSSIANQAKQIIKDNGFSEVITIIHGKCEEVELPVEKVDIIISEWMGYALLYESMLNSVLYARDRWLVPGGKLLPDRAQIKLSGIEDMNYKEQKISFWDDVYGFDMSCIKEIATLEPLVDVVPYQQVVTDFCTVLDLDCLTCTVDDLSFSAPFTLTANRDDYIHAIVAHFDCQFGFSHTPIELRTGPMEEPTHWKQTVFYLEDVLVIKAGESVTGRFSCTPNKSNHRDMDFVVEYDVRSFLQKMGCSDARVDCIFAPGNSNAQKD